MGNTIKLNDGFKVYDIENQHGEIIGQFKINPTDGKMVGRYNEAIKRLEDVPKQFEGAEDEIALFVELQEVIEKELLYIVGNDSVKVFFEVMGAFSIIDGQLYYEKVLEIIGGIINEEGQKRQQAMKQRIKEYGKRYQ